MTEYKCKVYVIEPQIGWHGLSLVAALDAEHAEHANQIIRKAAGESRYYWGYSHVREYDAIENNFDDLGKWLTEHFTRFGAQAVVLSAVIEKVEELKKELAEEENT